MTNRGGILLALTVGACATTGPSPCGGGEPLGCSIPTAIRVISEDYDAQADKFHDACVLHDLCYRHGAATYGHAREECDTEFYTNMKSACDGIAGLGVLDPEEFAKCRLAAKETYEAVKAHGEKHYRTTTSTYCDYRASP
jgi:coproporphyrinogen III oxidase